jgi:hypothetical protein
LYNLLVTFLGSRRKDNRFRWGGFFQLT